MQISKPIKSPWILQGLLVVLIAVLFGALTGAFFAITSDLPQIRALQEYRPPAVTQIFSSDDVLIAELYDEKRTPVPLEQIPQMLKSAVLATEDRNFFKHIGVDLKGILRAVLKNISAGQFVEGASTLTQQLAKTLFLTPEKSIARKIKEAVLAIQIERRFSKNEILALYLNQVYLGSGAYGVEAAARIYFGKPVEALDLAECALIAGLPKAPSRFSPWADRERAVKRRNVVLRQMQEMGLLTETDFRQTFEAPIRLKRSVPAPPLAPYFVDYVKTVLEDRLGAALLYKGGLTVKTTLSMTLQRSAETAVRKGLSALKDRMVHARIENPAPQGALIALDVPSGGIRAMVGGKNFIESPYNRATAAKRQPGSAFKPFVYACALEKGFFQNQVLLDTPVVYQSGRRGKEWRPKNFSKTYLGEITMRKALAISENIPTLRLIEKIGPDCVVRLAKRAGVKSRLSPNLSLALGTSEVTLLELTAAYALFANKGEWVKPECIMEVRDAGGRLLFEPAPERRVVMSPTDAAVMTDMLRGVIEEGTGKRARSLGHSLAGKTGTTDDCRDALFIGYAPFLAAGVWVGEDIPRSLGRWETGARAALPIWIDFMRTALADGAHAYFDLPDDAVFLYFDPDSGRMSESPFGESVKGLFPKTIGLPPGG